MTQRWWTLFLKPRGVSLMEALVAILLLGIVVGLIASLAGEYGNIITYNRGNQKTAEAQRALQRIVDEVSRAVEITTPEDSNLVDKVEFQVVNTHGEARWKTGQEWDDDGEEPTADYGLWAPARALDRLRIVYSLDQGRLLRSVTKANQAPSTTVVAEGILGFNVSMPQPELIKLEVSVQEAKRVVTFTGAAYRWLR